MNTLTQTKLKEVLEYRPETGEFVWLKCKRKGFKLGAPAGTKRGDGYVLIQVDGKVTYAHQMAFLYMAGEIPAEIDHIDHDRSNNRWGNLRAVTRTENQRNRVRSRNNKSGITGVCFDCRRGKWLAYITLDGAVKQLGAFYELEDAMACRLAANTAHEFHPNHGAETAGN